MLIRIIILEDYSEAWVQIRYILYSSLHFMSSSLGDMYINEDAYTSGKSVDFLQHHASVDGIGSKLGYFFFFDPECDGWGRKGHSFPIYL